MSNESLKFYITGGDSSKCSYLCDNLSQRINRQVAHLASVDANKVLTQEDVETAKKALTLSTGSWVIGFTECMEELHQKLLLYAYTLHGGYNRDKRSSTPHVSLSAFSEMSEADGVVLNQELRDILDSQCSLDDQLYNWAWAEAQTNEDGRFAGTC
jgi:hypothetical protein